MPEHALALIINTRHPRSVVSLRPSPLYLPSPNLAAGSYYAFAPNGPVVIVGANGAGKSRLGAWLEIDGPQQGTVVRVGAQRSLRIPEEVTPRARDLAELAYRTGMSGQTNAEFLRSIINNPQQERQLAKSNRWSGDFHVGMLNDFDPLLSVLFSEHTDVAVRLLETLRESPAAVHGTTAPDTRLARVKRVWERALPHRKLHISGNSIEAQPVGGGPSYKAAAMSDGERVAFYLISQCVAARPGAILVVDEPEIHLHRAMQARLWDEIEYERPDCLFVYLTHDLDFAGTRAGATKIWLKSYEGGRWDWEFVPDSTGLPENVLLSVLGSRRPVLFVEGDPEGLEQAVFSRVYPDWTVVPRGGCEAVIASTTAFRALSDHHHLECRGIIDRDLRSDNDVAALLPKGVHVLSVHEIEHLLLVEGALRAVAERQSMDPDSVSRAVMDWVLGELLSHREVLASEAAAHATEKDLQTFDRRARGAQALRAAVDALPARVDIETLYARAEACIDAALSAHDYAAALSLYSIKGLVQQVNRFFNLGPNGYVSLVKRLLTTPDGDALLVSLRQAAPDLGCNSSSHS